MTTRMEKAAEIAVNRRIVKHQDGNSWFVQSDKKDNVFYKVTEDNCECYDFQHHSIMCKHMLAVLLREGLPLEVKA